MDEFAILTNRKRALIALAHSVVFLAIALHGFAAPRARLDLHHAGAGMVLLLIYATVASVLAYLARVARCTRERIYFALCAGSASSGLLRTAFGDAAFPAAQYLRVFFLSYAVLMGLWILRSHAAQALGEGVNA